MFLGLDGFQWFLVLDLSVLCASLGIAGALFIKLRGSARAPRPAGERGDAPVDPQALQR